MIVEYNVSGHADMNLITLCVNIEWEGSIPKIKYN